MRSVCVGMMLCLLKASVPLFTLIHAILQMVKGKENQTMLLQELRRTHALSSEEQELQKADREFVLALKRQRDQHRAQVTTDRRHAVKRSLNSQILSTFCLPLLRPPRRKQLELKWWAQSLNSCSTPCPRS